MDRTQEQLSGEPCPPQIDQALALLSVGTVVLDMDLTEAALEADLLLRDENPRWVPVKPVPSTYQPPRSGWLDVATAEAALHAAVDLLDAHADAAATPAERLIGTSAVERLMGTLRHRPECVAWAARTAPPAPPVACPSATERGPDR